MSSDDAATRNIGWQFSRLAQQRPASPAVVEPVTRSRTGIWKYRSVSFAQLDEDSSRIAGGLKHMGVVPGTRLVLLVRPGIDFVSLVLGLLKARTTMVLVDPGIGRSNLLTCLEEAQPDGFITYPFVHIVRMWYRHRFPRGGFHVTVGRPLWSGMKSLSQLRSAPPLLAPSIESDDEAAIIFTSGSTGPPKGVLYRQQQFLYQVTQIRDQYGIAPGEIDLPGFPLFALFNSVMGVTTVFPKMDFTRPAKVNAQNIVEHVRDWHPTQAFGSPAFWNTVGRYCETKGARLPSIRRALSAGAPVPPHVIRRVRQVIHPTGEVYTPYGATEALPVASTSGSVILSETASQSAQGCGTCVGTRFSEIRWRVIAITDDPIPTIDHVKELPRGEIGELIVQGPVVTERYVTRTEANGLAKIADDTSYWHRMGDCGYLDAQDRFWFCGRKSHRVPTSSGLLFTIPCEAIANGHPHVYRSALIGLDANPRPTGFKTPAMLVETWPEQTPTSQRSRQQLLDEVFARLQQFPITQGIARKHLLWHPGFPVDIRHNAKIFREQLVPWAAAQLASLVDR